MMMLPRHIIFICILMGASHLQAQSSFEELTDEQKQTFREAMKEDENHTAAIVKSAEDGSIESMFEAARRYEVIHLDCEKAAHWYERAAKRGHVEAMFFRGRMLCPEEGVPQSDGETIRWYQMAAERGHSHSQFQLGGMYRDGRGITRDYMTAYAWFSVAAANGHMTQVSTEILDEMERKMSSEQIAEAQSLAKRYFSAVGGRKSQKVESAR